MTQRRQCKHFGYTSAGKSRGDLIISSAQKSSKKEQEVFLGVKGNAQLLGMKGAETETNIWKIRLQLMKPVTWIPLIWGEIWGLLLF